ncbi:MAG: hypothetical protein F2887_02890, partial [Actinobacteria bacterium]|nr:hypothetical protein [Actinomycetota bacterium]
MGLVVFPGFNIDGFGLVAGEIRGNFVGGFPLGNSSNPGTNLFPFTPKIVEYILRTPTA